MQPQLLVPLMGTALSSKQPAASGYWGGRLNPHPTTSDKWYCLAPPSQGLPLGRAVPVGRQGGLLYYLAPPSQVPPLGRANHISITCDITKGATSAERR